MTHRRQLNTLLLGGLFAASGAAWPQAGARRPVVGVLITDAFAARTITLPAFLKGLQDRGYVDGKNITLEIRSSSGKPEALPGVAAELVQLKADVIFVTGPAPIRAVLGVTRTIPIVALDLETEPVKAGWAQSLARPGGNLTGLFLDLPRIAGKWLQLLREAAPRAQRVGVLWDSTSGSVQLDAVKAVAKDLGAELIVLEVGSA